MEVFFIAIIFFILICLLIIFLISTYNQFQELIVRINEAEANIDSVLRKRFDLLNKSINIIKTNIDYEGDVLDLIVKLRSRKISNFDLDRQIYEAINEFNYFKDHYQPLKENEALIKIDKGLEESEIEIIALRRYYNDTITLYNKMVKKLPSSMVAKMCKYKEKNYYDGKDLNDDIIKDFKL